MNLSRQLSERARALPIAPRQLRQHRERAALVGEPDLGLVATAAEQAAESHSAPAAVATEPLEPKLDAACAIRLRQSTSFGRVASR